MSINYAPRLPKDINNEVNQQCPPAKKVLATTASDNNVVSAALTLNDGTTAIEVVAGGQPAVIKWIATSDTEASVISGAGGDFDHAIPANSYRRFVVPVETMGVGNTSSVVGANSQSGLYKRVAVATAQIGSVMTTEY